eukprot:13733685-Alexandrium_andersonii.AAC.1
MSNTCLQVIREIRLAAAQKCRLGERARAFPQVVSELVLNKGEQRAAPFESRGSLIRARG